MKQRRTRPATPPRPVGNVAGHFTKQGVAKKRYRTATEARSAAQLAWTLEGIELSAYRCDHCHLWHIGGPPRED